MVASVVDGVNPEVIAFLVDKYYHDKKAPTDYGECLELLIKRTVSKMRTEAEYDTVFKACETLWGRPSFSFSIRRALLVVAAKSCRPFPQYFLRKLNDEPQSWRTRFWETETWNLQPHTWNLSRTGGLAKVLRNTRNVHLILRGMTTPESMPHVLLLLRVHASSMRQLTLIVPNLVGGALALESFLSGLVPSALEITLDGSSIGGIEHCTEYFRVVARESQGVQTLAMRH